MPLRFSILQQTNEFITDRETVNVVFQRRLKRGWLIVNDRGHFNKNIFIVVEYQLYYPGTLILFTIQKNESD